MLSLRPTPEGVGFRSLRVTPFVDNVEFEDVTQPLLRGDEDTLRKQLENGLGILEGEDLNQGKKRDLEKSAVPEESVEKLRR